MKPQYLQIEARAVEQLFGNAGNFSLASGMAGALLLEAHLYGQAPSDARRRHIACAVDMLVESIRNSEQSISLWTGLVGTLYAFEYTRSISPDLLPRPVHAFIDDMDEQLIAYLAASDATRQFDVISGIAGIGAYAIMRTDYAAGRQLYHAVETALMMSASIRPIGSYWRTRPEHIGRLAPLESRVHGHVDLGLAHGLPGVIQLMAGALRHGLAGGATAALLEQATTTLTSLRSDRFEACQFGYYAPQTSVQPSRLGWCYGDLSAGFALHSAGLALEKCDWRAQAQQIVLDRIAHAEQTFFLSDKSLCHGHAGALHMVRKLDQAMPAASYTQFISRRNAALDNGDGEAGMPPGLLEGSAGILLAMNDGLPRGRHHWDVCLCMGF